MVLLVLRLTSISSHWVNENECRPRIPVEMQPMKGMIGEHCPLVVRIVNKRFSAIVRVKSKYVIVLLFC